MKLNYKINIVLSILFALINLFFKYSLIIDYISSGILLTVLIFNFVKRNSIEDYKFTISYYFSWLFISICIIYIRNVGLSFWTPLLLIFTIKCFVLILYYLKFQNYYVTKTLLGYIWLFSLFLYLCELILNSTHGFATICLNLAIISAIENILILVFHKKQFTFQTSFLNTIARKFNF